MERKSRLGVGCEGVGGGRVGLTFVEIREAIVWVGGIAMESEMWLKSYGPGVVEPVGLRGAGGTVLGV